MTIRARTIKSNDTTCTRGRGEAPSQYFPADWGWLWFGLSCRLWLWLFRVHGGFVCPFRWSVCACCGLVTFVPWFGASCWPTHAKKCEVSVVDLPCLNSFPRIPTVKSGRLAGALESVDLNGPIQTPLVTRAALRGASLHGPAVGGGPFSAKRLWQGIWRGVSRISLHFASAM